MLAITGDGLFSLGSSTTHRELSRMNEFWQKVGDELKPHCRFLFGFTVSAVVCLIIGILCQPLSDFLDSRKFAKILCWFDAGIMGFANAVYGVITILAVSTHFRKSLIGAWQLPVNSSGFIADCL